MQQCATVWQSEERTSLGSRCQDTMIVAVISLIQTKVSSACYLFSYLQGAVIINEDLNVYEITKDKVQVGGWQQQLHKH